MPDERVAPADDDAATLTTGALVAAGFVAGSDAPDLAERAKQRTWFDALQSLGLEGSALEDALALVEDTAAGPIDEVTPEAPGRYRPIELLGAGGMGQVALVEDRHLNRMVARKELHAQRPAIAARFLREARITALLEHPGIVPVHELGRAPDGRLYFTMKRVQGRTLRAALDEAGSLKERLKLITPFVEVCQAVGYAHAQGVVHRDLKPENVMIGPFGETLVVDWGLAKVAGEPELPAIGRLRSGNASASGSDLTRAGTVMGTPRYMSPEQAAGRLQDIDARSDVWSLGVILYEILCGEAPFQGSPESVMMQVQQGLAAPIRESVTGAPPELAAICEKALGTSRGERYDHAGELAEEIEAWRSGATVGAHVYSPVERARRMVERFQWAIAGALVSAVTLGLAAAWVAPRLQDATARTAELERHAAFLSRLVKAAEIEDRGKALALLREAERWAGEDEREAAARRIRSAVAEGADVRVFPRPAEAGAPVWSADGGMLAWTEPDGVVLVDPRSGGALGRVRGERPIAASFDRRGSRLFVLEARAVREVTLVDATDKHRYELPFDGVSLRVSEDGRWLAVDGADAQAVFDLEARQGPLDPLAVPAIGAPSALVTAEVVGDAVRVRGPSIGERSLRAGVPLRGAAVSPDGEVAAWTAEDLRLWSLSAPGRAPQTNLRACGDGRVVAVLPFPRPDELSPPRACGG